MFKIEEIEIWNQVFEDGKIQESNLKNPTEQFLVKTLVAFLEKLGYKIEFSFVDCTGERLREKRLFLIRLARKIDYILKCTNKTYAFTYFDLIKPVPKKTSHILGILLNHYYYYDMFKNDVFSLANGRIHSRQNLLLNIEDTQRENEKRKQYSEKIKEEIIKLSAEVPACKTELDSWKTKFEEQKKEFEKEQNSFEELNKKLAVLQTQSRNLKKEIVDDCESLKLQEEIVKLEKSKQHYHELQNNLNITLKERMEIISDMENLNKILETTNQICNPKILQEYKEISAKLKQKILQHTKLLEETATLMETISKQQDKLNSIMEQSKNKRREFELAKTKNLKAIEEKEKAYNSMVRECSCLRLLDQNIVNQLQEQKEMRDYMVNLLTQLNINIHFYN